MRILEGKGSFCGGSEMNGQNPAHVSRRALLATGAALLVASPQPSRAQSILGSAIDEAAALIRPNPTIDLKRLAAGLPKGDGSAVLAIPGSLRDDSHTETLRDMLIELGYRPYGWEQGTNWGPTKRLIDGASARLEAISAASGKVSVIGFSMGGLFARYLGRRQPEHVRQVMTICSPFADPIDGPRFAAPFAVRLWYGQEILTLADEIRQPLSTPGTFLYTKTDGVVVWRHCIDESVSAQDNIEFQGQHVDAAHNPNVLKIIGERLQVPRA
jgi:pimeloyl-ACP methyl ester carboxylesterase